MKLTQKLIKKINDTTKCYIVSEPHYYCIQVDNPCGEDFSFEVRKSPNEVEDIITYCDNFDSDEHFSLWFGQNRGEPSSARVLLDNCEDIAESLSALADLLR